MFRTLFFLVATQNSKFFVVVVYIKITDLYPTCLSDPFCFGVPKKSSMNRCVMCDGDDQSKLILYVPFIKNAAVCVNCFNTKLIDCDECTKLLVMFVKTLVMNGHHPTRTSIRSIRKADILGCLTLPWKIHLEQQCLLELQDTWSLQFHEHLCCAHRVPHQNAMCDACAAQNTAANIRKCTRCCFLKCDSCFSALMCDVCFAIQCRDCILTCANCDCFVCPKDSWECVQCCRVLCKQCSDMMTCDMCYELFCQDCQSTFQEIDPNHTICCFQCF